MSPWCPRFDDGFKVHRIKVTPLTLCGVILDLAGIGAFCATVFATTMLDFDDHFRGLNLKVNVDDFPRCLEVSPESLK